MAEEQVTAVEQQSQPSEQTAATETSWRDSLSDDLKTNASLQKFSDVGTLAKSYINAEQMIGKDKMVVPGDNTTEDEWNDIYNKLGRPQEPGAYELKHEVGEEYLNQDMLTKFKETAHKYGLSPKQAQGVLDHYQEITNQVNVDNDNSVMLTQQENERSLREEWGRSYDENINKASSLAKTFLGEEILTTKLADGSNLGDSADLIRGLTKIANLVSEDKLVGDKTSTVDTANIQSQINTLTDAGGAYWNKMDPNHQSTVDKVLALREMLSS